MELNGSLFCDGYRQADDHFNLSNLQAVMEKAPSRSINLLNKIHYLSSLTRTLGLVGAVVYQWQTALARRGLKKAPYRLRSRESKHCLWCRPGTSDLAVFNQVFLAREYATLLELSDIDFIVDCGANVGYTSAFFLTAYPSCKLIAVEPEKSNFEQLRLNLKGFGTRAQVVQAGVWSHPCRLKLAENPYRDGSNWAKQVRPAFDNEQEDFPAIDIPTLLELSGSSRISILKVDIEGAEAVLFGPNCLDWIHLVDNIAIELHDDSCFGSATEVWTKAIDTKDFLLTKSGELTIAKRRQQ